MKKSLGVLAAALLLPVALIAADKVESGLKVGASVPAFNVRDITGPAKGETLCYRCRYGAPAGRHRLHPRSHRQRQGTGPPDRRQGRRQQGQEDGCLRRRPDE